MAAKQKPQTYHIAKWTIYLGFALIIFLILAGAYGSMKGTSIFSRAAGITPTSTPFATPMCTLEVCDGKDNDCDGMSDEGGVCLTLSVTPLPSTTRTRTPTPFSSISRTPTRTMTPTPFSSLSRTPTRTRTPTPFSISVTPPALGNGVNLIVNHSFELDADNNQRPDSWTEDSRITRSNAEKIAGNYSARFYSTSNETATMKSQKVAVSTSSSYTVKTSVNIPTTSDSFTLATSIEYFDINGTILRSDPIYSRTTHTSGAWTLLGKSYLYPPANATKARIVIQAKSLNGTIYVDSAELFAQ